MKKIAVLTGGLGSERPIALVSAENVAKALAPHFEVTVFTLPEELPKFLAEYDQFAAAVPIMHGKKGGEDGTIQGLLTWLNLPFVFSSVHAHAAGLNKLTAKELVSARGIKTAAYRVVDRDLVAGAPSLGGFPAIVKPVDSGSTLGVSLARSARELVEGLEKAFTESDSVFVEDYIQGDEFTVAVIDEAGHPLALPVISIKSKNVLFDYDAKYKDGMAEEVCPALIDDALAARLQEVAVKAHLAIGARHVSRSDMILDQNGQIWFLEINTIPGMSLLLPKAIRASGRNFGEVLKGWVLTVAR